MTGLRQALLVVFLGLASFGALFAVARADGGSEPEPAKKAAPVRHEAPPAASVNVTDLRRAEPLPAMRVRRPPPEPEPVVETPVVEPVEPVEPVAPPVYQPPPSTPAPSTPSPPPADPGESFDDWG